MGLIDRIWIVFAALNGAIAVGTGAYASHALAAQPQAQEWFRIAGQYQMAHALALMLLVALGDRMDRAALRIAGWLFVAGILLFCGTLYALATVGPLPVPMTAPAGGWSFMLGWVALAAAALRARG
ncbi:uncharacterized membrane protein YgdD (TMEM256/DUF423 family) [Azospirillum lipoferum]|uniref:DUF423 domain-containing protein n=1 Tax=Azospirillum lipoferum TaxID=193 RepID=A0A5A9GJX5_AZOLI|nr:MULTISPECIES: DUF423 domain-containing protein [Azospirillum]KAA0594145.1 DUF423 domain-containing protein [Azospirillum lipoferum]MCP1612640.1 uncharacterized membrane protein YgdD (TMEM256/DUF423 family) [Azospirillum lipoferum]MDW5531578.1 DUF423 domain-containing protein [Azospirillum sp. NL1]